MTTHHCIGNPCWICYPDLAPKSEDKHYIFLQDRLLAHQFTAHKMSDLLKEMLIEIFESGLGEDAHYRCNQDLKLEKIKEERLNMSDNSLEANLLDLMIKDFEQKGEI
jgi:hypothetical protein